MIRAIMIGMKKIVTFVALIILFLVPVYFVVHADLNSDIENLGKKIDVLNKNISSAEVSHQNLVDQLNTIKNSISAIEIQIQQKEQEVKQGEQALIYQKLLLNERVRSYYKNVGQSSVSLLDILVAKNLSDSLQKFFYQKSLVDQDKNTILKIVLYIKNLEEIKANLQSENVKLAELKIEVDKQSQILENQIAQMKQQVAELSAQQQQLIAQKLASLNIPLYADTTQGGCSSDINPYKDPGFGSTKFGFFTYGVPNRVGLSQYGAWGRAKAEEDYMQILQAYYNFDSLSDTNQGIQIRVSGNGIDWTGSLEDYVKRVYEVPDSWTDNNLAALKAQAIAARSYVLAYTNNGQSSICPTQQCQVFQTIPKGGNWEQAVDKTAGKVMTQGGQPVKAWFSSTHGGYVHSSGDIGWSNTSFTKNALDASGSVGSFSDLNNKAYDKDSPWFYCDWGNRSQYNNTAWLTGGEVADIANVLMLVQKDSSTAEHLYQIDKPNPAGTDTWDADRVKQELKNRGGNPYNSVSDVLMSVDFGSGKTTTVTVSGDSGSTSFTGIDFKNYFNLRAPANIQIVGPLFNVEKR